jgi:hypothetical protein
VIPMSTDTTMSVDTGDYDNDLVFDIYVAQVAAGATGASAHIARKPLRFLLRSAEPRGRPAFLSRGDGAEDVLQVRLDAPAEQHHAMQEDTSSGSPGSSARP